MHNLQNFRSSVLPLVAVTLLLSGSQYTKAQVGAPAVRAKVQEKTAKQKDKELLEAAGVTLGFDSDDSTSVRITDENLTTEGGLKPGVLAALKKTTTLEAISFQGSRNATDAVTKDIKGFTAIRKLHFHYTKITDAGLEDLKGMTKLTELYLGGTAVTDKGLAHLKGIETLTMLDLDGLKGVTDAGLAQLKLGKLDRLHIGDTKVTDAGLALLKDSTKLTVLWANGCTITDKGLEHLKPLVKLSWIKFEKTNITDAGLVNLKGMTMLFSLDLAYCKGVADPGLSHLEKITELSSFNVEGTAVTKAGAEKLKAKLPRCSIQGTNWELKSK